MDPVFADDVKQMDISKNYVLEAAMSEMLRLRLYDRRRTCVGFDNLPVWRKLVFYFFYKNASFHLLGVDKKRGWVYNKIAGKSLCSVVYVLAQGLDSIQ